MVYRVYCNIFPKSGQVWVLFPFQWTQGSCQWSPQTASWRRTINSTPPWAHWNALCWSSTAPRTGSMQRFFFVTWGGFSWLMAMETTFSPDSPARDGWSLGLQLQLGCSCCLWTFIQWHGLWSAYIIICIYVYIYIYHITSSSASAVRIHLRSGNCCHPQHPLLSTFSKADLQMCVCVSETGAGRPPKRFNQIIFWWVRSWIIDQWINDDLSCFQTCHQDLRHRLDWPRSSFFFVSPSWSSALNISWFCPKIQNMSAILLGQIELRGSLFSDQPRMVVSGW